jgi:hypothetical protein
MKDVITEKRPRTIMSTPPNNRAANIGSAQSVTYNIFDGRDGSVISMAS